MLFEFFNGLGGARMQCGELELVDLFLGRSRFAIFSGSQLPDIRVPAAGWPGVARAGWPMSINTAGSGKDE
jgi:hypothetical protein